MIDLHCHILPGIDDGAHDLEASLKMARIAVADGIKIVACTPHIKAPIYRNTAEQITQATGELQKALDASGIGLELRAGADIHLTADLLQMLDQGTAPVLAGSKYFLLEPSHNVMPPHIDRFCETIIAQGYIPILTHPERLTWITHHFDTICKLDALGLVMQLTAGSIVGQFGKTAQYWSERMLAEGRVDIIASDAHDPIRRVPILSKARDVIEQQYGAELATRLVRDNPRAILDNSPVAPRENRTPLQSPPAKSFFDRIRRR